MIINPPMTSDKNNFKKPAHIPFAQNDHTLSQNK